MRAFFLIILIVAIGVGCGTGVNPLNSTNVSVDPADIDATPGVGAISPTSGTLGTLVIIDGSNFSATTTVNVGASPCRRITLVSSSQLTCTVGTHGPGLADVTVSNSSGNSSVLSGAFTFTSYLYALDSGNAAVRGFEIAATDG